MYTMDDWMLRGFMCTSRVVRWRGVYVSWVMVVGASASAFGDRRVCGRCLIRVSSMHYIKSIRMFENFEEWFPYLGYLRMLISALPPYLCALTVNLIGLLFLRQCLVGLPPSTETLIIGTSPQLLICL